MKKKLFDIVPVVLAAMKKLYMNKAALARKCNWAPATITHLFKKRDWTISELKMVGWAVNEDLVAYFLDIPTDGMVPATTMQDLMKELSDLKATEIACHEKMVKLRTENDLMKVLLDSMRKGE